MLVLIVGGERLGRMLAANLLDQGHQVRLLDERERVLAQIEPGFSGQVLQGSPLERGTLAGAAAGCDALAAVSADDCLNVTTALAARRELGVPLALAAVSEPRLAHALVGLEARIVCPTTRTARELHLALVRSGVESELLLGESLAVYRAELPARLAGRTLGELERPGELVPIALERAGHFLLAVPGLAIETGDVLHVAASAREIVADLARP